MRRVLGPGGAARLGRFSRLAAYLIGWQSITQLAGLVSGLLLLRWLSINEYAKYTFAFSFASMVSQLVDLGFADSITGLIGERADEPEVIGSYMKAALSLRWLVCLIFLPLSAVPFFILSSGHGWGLTTELLLFATVVGALTTRTMVDYYSIPLVIRGRLGSLYGAQLPVAVGRLAANALFKITGLLRGWTAAAIYVLGMATTGAVMKARAQDLVTLPQAVDKRYRSQIIKMVVPLLPGQVFFALQGQITIVIASTLGGTVVLAQVGAVSRFAQGFAILAAINSYIFLPRIARARSDAVRRNVVLALGGTSVLLGLIVITAFSFPGLLTLLLGPRYHNLGYVAGWYILSQAILTLDGTLYTINLARKFIWWWSTIAQVGLIAVADIAMIAVVGVHSVLHLQYLLVGSAVASLVGAVGSLLYGLRVESRPTDRSSGSTQVRT